MMTSAMSIVLTCVLCVCYSYQKFEHAYHSNRRVKKIAKNFKPTISSLIFLLAYRLAAEDFQLPDGRLFDLPNPESYSYILRDESPSSLERLYVLSYKTSKVSLLCPKGYSIIEITQELVVNQSFSHLISNNIEKRHTASLLNENEPGRYKDPLCPPLYDCLGYQACLFQFSPHLCHKVTIPLTEYSLLLTISCFRDDKRLVATKFKKQKDLVLHIYHQHQKHQLMTDLSHMELQEIVVFDRNCSDPNTAKRIEGYQGSCSEFPPSAETTLKHLWPIIGRTLTNKCRNTLVQVYCAFQYNKKGFCLPPIFQDKNEKNKVISSHDFSKSIYRPGMLPYKKFLSEHNSFLIPTRLAFFIMVHTEPQAVKDLIQAIFREQFIYIVHVDKQATLVRKDITDWILHSNFPSHSISILPREKSFSAHQASYESVQAQLEGFKELLDLGPWDFLINLAEGDMPLRNVDDLSMALAPYRGSSFLSSIHSATENKMPNYYQEAFFGCDGFSYKLSPKTAPTNSEEFELFHAPRGGAFSRDFIEYLVDKNMHSSLVKKFQFYLQTDISPDESYIPSMIMNSPFRNSLQFAPILTNFQTGSKETLQESHFIISEDAEAQEIPELLSLSHSSFFARNLYSLSSPATKTFSLGLAKNNYYDFLESYLPTLILKVLVDKAIVQLSTRKNLLTHDFVLESVLNLHVVPSLTLHNACCKSKIIQRHVKFTDFNYWVDALLLNKINEKHEKVRIMLQPSEVRKTCFNDGDLKMMFVSQWLTNEKYSEVPEWLKLDLNSLLQIPYGPAYSDGIIVNLLFAKDNEQLNCTNTDIGIYQHNSLTFEDKTVKLGLRLILDKKVKCAQNLTVYWDAKNQKSSESGTVGKITQPNTILRNVTIECKNMKPGAWTIQLHRIEAENSWFYNLKFFLLDFQNVHNLRKQINDIDHLWQLKHFDVIDENYNFDFLKSVNFDESQKDFLNQAHDYPRKNVDMEDIVHQKTFHHSSGWLSDWLICNKGFASFVSICFIAILLYVWRYRVPQNLVMFFLLSLVIVAMMQITLFMTFCVQ